MKHFHFMFLAVFAFVGTVRAETITLRKLHIPADPARPVTIELEASSSITSTDSTGELSFVILHRFVTDQAGARLTTERRASEFVGNWGTIKRAYQTLARRLASNSGRAVVKAEAAAVLRDREWQTGREGYGDLTKRLSRLLERLTKPIRNTRAPVHPLLGRFVGGRDYLVPARWSAPNDVRLIAFPDAIVIEP